MLQVTSDYSKIFSNCGVDLYTGNTFNDAISCLKIHIDLYTRSTYTRVYTVRLDAKAKETKKSEAKDRLSDDRTPRGQGQECLRPVVLIFVEHWGGSIICNFTQFCPIFNIGGDELDHDFVQEWKFSEDQKKKQIEHFFPQIQVKTKKKVFNKNKTLFFPKFTLRCIPIQIIGGDANVDHSQTIGEIQPNYWGDMSPPSPPCFGTPV